MGQALFPPRTAAFGVAAPENKVTHWRCQPISKKVGTRCRSPSYERFSAGCSSLFMRLAEHLTVLRAGCKQYPAWLVKTRRAPSRHGRDARVYGRTTTAMHKLRIPPPPTRHSAGGYKNVIIKKTGYGIGVPCFFWSYYDSLEGALLSPPEKKKNGIKKRKKKENT